MLRQLDVSLRCHWDLVDLLLLPDLFGATSHGLDLLKELLRHVGVLEGSQGSLVTLLQGHLYSISHVWLRELLF